MTTKRNVPTRDLIRMTPASLRPEIVELRANPAAPPKDAGTSDGTDLGLLAGYPIVFDTWTEINSWWEGNFLERIADVSLDWTLSRYGDRVKVMFNHGYDFQIGDKPLGKPQRQEPMDYGMWAETPMSNTSYNRDLAELIRDKALDGQSFRFDVIDEEWHAYDEDDDLPDYNPKGLEERTIIKLRLYEHGPVTFPAYEATTLGLRSAGEVAAWRSGNEQVRSELIRAVVVSRDLRTDPADVLERLHAAPAGEQAPTGAPPAGRSDQSRASAQPPGHTSSGDRADGSGQSDESRATPATPSQTREAWREQAAARIAELRER
jgi:HK97 family phage prohead protease